MIWRVTKYACAFVAIFSAATFFPDIARSQIQASDCRTDRDWVDYREKGFKSEGMMYSECVAQGFPLVGRFSQNDISKMYLLSNNKIILRPKMDDKWFSLDWFSRGCLSRAYFDSICLKNSELFDSPYRQMDACPLPRLHEPSHDDLMQLAMNAAFGVRWGLCTTFSNRLLANPVKIGPGTFDRLYFNNDGREYVATKELTIDGLKAKFIDFQKLVVGGNLVFKKVNSTFLDLSQLVVLGDLLIEGSNIENVELSEAWIRGDVLIRSNTHKSVRINGVKVGGWLEWTDNTSRSGKFNIYDVKSLDLNNAPKVSKNRASGASDDNKRYYTEFLTAFTKSFEQTKKVRERN